VSRADGVSRVVHDPYTNESLALLEVEESVAQYLYKDNDPLGESEEIATLCLASLEDMSPTIPKEYADKISDVHNNLSGHHGVEKSLIKLLRQGHKWPYMREHVKRFIKLCPLCQKMSYLKAPIHVKPFTLAEYKPMVLISMDTIGPLGHESDGNNYVLVIIDHFTSWVELYAIPDTSAEAAVTPLVDYVGRYGVPAYIQSDSGTQFVNAVIK